MLCRLRHVIRIRSRGHSYYYHRPTRTRLPGTPDSPEFQARVAELNAQIEARGQPRPKPGSVGDVIAQYKASAEYLQLAAKTRADYARYLDFIGKAWGALPVAGLERRHVFQFRDSFPGKPRTANYAVQVLRLLLYFAVDRGMVAVNVAQRPKRLKTGPGHKRWTDAEIARFDGCGDAKMIFARDLGLYSGQRNGDCIRMKRSDYRDGLIRVVQSKTGEELWIPAHRALRSAIDAQPKDTITLLADENGKPFKIDNFSHRFHKAVLAAGLGGFTFHGLRHTATERLYEAGCTDKEVEAITGMKADATRRRYSKTADRKRLAKAAIMKLERREE